MPRFTSFQDFFGTYFGSFDGRNAQLVISNPGSDEVQNRCQITFTELDRNHIYRGEVEEKEQPHILYDISLKEIGGHDKLFWSRLYLHTWDIDYISGVSVAYSIEYGMCFKRVKD